MIKITLMSFLLTTLSCTQEPKKTELSDDYVLIEFAAKLEEEHNQNHSEPLDNNKL